MYRVKDEWNDGMPRGEVTRGRGVRDHRPAARELWRFLHNIDLTIKVDAHAVDPASPLLLNVRDVRALGLKLSDGLWLRLVDLDAALKARSYKPGTSVVLRGHGRPLSLERGPVIGSETTPVAPRTLRRSRSTPPISRRRTLARSTSTGSCTPGAQTSGVTARPRRRRCSSAPICPRTARRSSDGLGRAPDDEPRGARRRRRRHLALLRLRPSPISSARSASRAPACPSSGCTRPGTTDGSSAAPAPSRSSSPCPAARSPAGA